MSALATLNPAAPAFGVFLHVLAAMTLVGALVLASSALISAWRSDSPPLMRLSFRALLWAALPSWIVMRGTAEWIASEEGYSDLDDPPNWIDLGYMIAEPTLLLLIAATVLSGLAIRRAARNEAGGSLGRVAAALILLAIVAYGIVIWAMTTKPI